MKFAQKRSSCIGCKALLSKAEQTLCSHCKGREAELYCKTVLQVSQLEELIGRFWTQCQECHDSFRTCHALAGIVQYSTGEKRCRRIWWKPSDN